MSSFDALTTNRYVLIYCPPLYPFIFQVVSSFQHFRPEFYQSFSSFPSMLQALPSYLAVLYHPNNTWWPTRIMNLITYSAIYDYRTILLASCYFIPFRSKHYGNTPPSHSHHRLSCRPCTSRTVGSCWPCLTTRFKEHLYRLATTAYSLHSPTCSVCGGPSS